MNCIFLLVITRDADVYGLLNLLSNATPEDLTTEFCTGLTPLQYAAKTNGATISTLLDAGADPTLPHKSTGTTPLMFAARSGDVEAVRVLLEVLGRDAVDAVDEHGSTALGLCSLTCNVNVAKLLVAAGVNVFKRDASGNTPLHVGAFYCTESSGSNFASALLSADAALTHKHINDMSTFGRTALMLAAKQGHTGYFDTLVLFGADADLVSTYDQKTVADFQREYASRSEL